MSECYSFIDDTAFLLDYFQKPSHSLVMPSSLHKLPFDVWWELASFSRAGDLAAFSTTSSKFLSIIRPLFYRSAFLRLGSRHWRPAMDLLARDKMLASAVVELCLQGTFPRLDVGPPINSDAIANMTSLKRVWIRGAVWSTELEQFEIGRILAAKTSTSLEELSYRTVDSRVEWCSPEVGGLGGLKVIEWRCYKQGGDCARNSPLKTPPLTLNGIFSVNLNLVWPILSGSLQTCHRLVLPSLAFEGDKYHLSSINISNLRSLVVSGGWSTSLVKERLARFLLSHGTIEELHIHNTIQPDTSLFTPGTLPHLSSFDGSASIIGNMASIRMTCLSGTLRHLAVRSPDLHSLMQMLEQLQSANDLGHSSTNHARHSRLLAGLRDIRVSISTERIVDIKAIIRDFGTLCGDSLDTWRGYLTMESISAREFADLFQPYKQLGIIELDIQDRLYGYFDHKMNWFPSENDHIQSVAFAYVLELAKHCPTLQRVRIYKLSIKLDHVWDIVRTPKPRFQTGGNSCPGPMCTRHYVYVPNSSGE